MLVNTNSAGAFYTFDFPNVSCFTLYILYHDLEVATRHEKDLCSDFQFLL